MRSRTKAGRRRIQKMRASVPLSSPHKSSRLRNMHSAPLSPGPRSSPLHASNSRSRAKRREVLKRYDRQAVYSGEYEYVEEYHRHGQDRI